MLHSRFIQYDVLSVGAGAGIRTQTVPILGSTPSIICLEHTETREIRREHELQRRQRGGETSGNRANLHGLFTVAGTRFLRALKRIEVLLATEPASL